MFDKVMSFGARMAFPFVNSLSLANMLLPRRCTACLHGNKQESAQTGLVRKWQAKVGHKDVELLHTKTDGCFPYPMGHMLFRASHKAIVIDKELETIDPDATLFLAEKEFCLLKNCSTLLQKTAIAICDVATLIFLGGEFITPMAQMVTRALIQRIGRGALMRAHEAAIDASTKEELVGGFRFYSALQGKKAAQGSLYEELFSPTIDNDRLLAKIEAALKGSFKMSQKSMDAIKNDQKTVKISQLLDHRVII